MRNILFSFILFNALNLNAQEVNPVNTDDQKQDAYETFSLNVVPLAQQKILNESIPQQEKLVIQNLKELCDSDFTKNYLIQNIKNLQDENKELKKLLEESRKQNLMLEKVTIKCESDLNEKFWNNIILGGSTTIGAFIGSATCIYLNNNNK